MSAASGSEMSSSGSESDIEMQSALPALTKKTKKTPRSPSDDLLKNQDPKKMTTKDMIKEALAEQKSRKGISLHAIRKFIMEKHTVNVDRITTLIKKSLKSGIEDGSIVQTKGIGASGSFKLAPKKKDGTEKPKKKPKLKPSEKTEKAKKTKKENVEKVTKKKVEAKTSKERKDKPEKKEKTVKKVGVKEKKDKTKMAKTPAKKRAAMMKRKSIGSIIKPPKMKPKA